jgi:hypothetical protein
MIDSQPTVVRPSRLVRVVIKPMTRVMNPLIRRLAGRTHFPNAAQIHHRGRNSGHHYVTPASARLLGDTIFIPLTFTRGSDWCRNVLAAGHCTIRLKGTDHLATEPELLEKDTALGLGGSAFRRMERLMFRPLGIREFLTLRVVAS